MHPETTQPANEAVAAPPGVIRYFGDYELIEEVARGGMGVVFKARQVSLNRTVAVKMILAGALAGEGEVRRFRREAEAAANLDHPAIVPIYEVGEHQGQHFFSMGYVEGPSLAQKLAAGPLPEAAAIELLVRVAEAVQAAHERGILHRDLKPGNVLLDGQGRPRVTDFGLARPLRGGSDLTDTGQVLGTPSYMPPEQARGQAELGPEADVYGLGAILYVVLTGRPPFQAASPLETVRQVLDQDPVAPRALNPALGRDLETICLKALDKEPARRYASARSFAEDLQRYLRGEPIRARRASTWERGLKWARRRPALAALSAVAALAALCAVGLAVAARYNALLRIALQSESHLRTRAEQRELDSARYWYAADVNLAHRYWRDARVDRARALLERQRPESIGREIRGFEWWYLWRQCHQEAQRTPPFGGEPTGLAAAGGDLVAALVADEAGSPGGKQGRLVSIDPRTGTLRRTLRSSARLTQVVLAPGGTTWAGLEGPDIVMGDFGGGSPRVVRANAGNPNLVALSPDGRWLLASTDLGGDQVIDTRSGEVCSTLPDDRSALVAAFDDGGTLVIAGVPQGRGDFVSDTTAPVVLRVWDVASSSKRADLATRLQYVGALAFARGGSTLVAGGWRYSGSGLIEVWDAAREVLKREITGHADAVTALAVAPDGATLASGAGDRTVKLWQLAEGDRTWITWPGRLKATYRGHALSPVALAFAADGRTLASADDSGTVLFWDAGSDPECQRLGEHPWRIGTVLYTPDGSRVVAVDNSDIAVYEAATGRRLERFPAGDWVFAAALTPDGKTLAVGGRAGLIRLFDLAARRAIVDLSPGDGTEWVTALALAPDGQTLTVARASSVQLWDLASRRLKGTLPVIAESLAYSPDGHLLATSSHGGRVQFWDTSTGATHATLAASGPVIFAPDGRTCVTRSASGHEIVVWDLNSRQAVRTMPSPGIPLAISPDGRTLVSCEDAHLVLYQMATGQELLTLTGLSYGAASAAFSPDGSVLATGGGSRDENDGVVLWKAAR
jgi:WD40 repeat protein/predicted Ser/Thr protein kinase